MQNINAVGGNREYGVYGRISILLEWLQMREIVVIISSCFCDTWLDLKTT